MKVYVVMVSEVCGGGNSNDWCYSVHRTLDGAKAAEKEAEADGAWIEEFDLED